MNTIKDIARQLKTNPPQVLGVIVSRFGDPFISEVLQGIDDLAQESGCCLLISSRPLRAC